MTATTAAGLSDDQLAHYRDHGFLHPLHAMDREDAHHYRRTLEQFEAQHPAQAAGILRSKSHLALTWVQELIRLDPVVDVVESIVGPNVWCWGSSFFIKDPHHPKFIAWHQDAPFSAIPPGAELLTAWIALAPSLLENGCLKVVGGTHTTEAEHVFTENDANMLSQGQEIAVEVDEADASAIQLVPGEFSLHHQFIFHGSGPSVSDERRIGIAVRYMRPFEPSAGAPVPATRIRGEDPFGCFEPEPVPSTDMDPAALAYRDAQLVKRHGDRYRTSR